MESHEARRCVGLIWRGLGLSGRGLRRFAGNEDWRARRSGDRDWGLASWGRKFDNGLFYRLCVSCQELLLYTTLKRSHGCEKKLEIRLLRLYVREACLLYQPLIAPRQGDFWPIRMRRYWSHASGRPLSMFIHEILAKKLQAILDGARPRPPDANIWQPFP